MGITSHFLKTNHCNWIFPYGFSPFFPFIFFSFASGKDLKDQTASFISCFIYLLSLSVYINKMCMLCFDVAVFILLHMPLSMLHFFFPNTFD